MIVNIAAYHFVAIADPPALAARLRERAEALQLRGTALVAGEGINLFLAGAAQAIEDVLGELRADPRFADLIVKYSRSRGMPFARLKVKLKRTDRQSFRDQENAAADALDPEEGVGTNIEITRPKKGG